MPRVTGPAPGPALTDAQQFWQLPGPKLHRLLALTRQVDTVELKLVVPVEDQDAVVTSLGVDFARASARRVWFLDTPDRRLERDGVVARIRSVSDRADDSVIKLRPVAPGDLPARLRRSKNFVVEVDAMPGRYVCSGALVRRRGVNVERTLTEGRPLRELFTGRQLELLPRGIRVDDLAVFGPVEVRRSKIAAGRKGLRLAVERWTYPDGSRILELSTRCPAGSAVPVAARLSTVLRAHRVDVTGHQQTKTQSTLEYFREVS